MRSTACAASASSRRASAWRRTSWLRGLTEHGILETAPASDGSAYQEYLLTKKGLALFPLLVALRQWGEEYFFEPGEEHVRLVDLKTGRPVRKLELRAHDGRLLGPADTRVKPASGQDTRVKPASGQDTRVKPASGQNTRATPSPAAVPRPAGAARKRRAHRRAIASASS
jgi:hypothetical protein